MRDFLTLLFASIFIFIGANNSNAELIDYSNISGHVVYDDESKLTWFWDLSYFTGQTASEQIAAINSLNESGNEYFGVGGWHLADSQELTTLTLFTLDPMWAYVMPHWGEIDLDIIAAFNPVYEEIDDHGMLNKTYDGRFLHLFLDPDFDDAILSFLLETTYWGDGNYTGSYEYFGDDSNDTGLGAWVVTDTFSPVPVPDNKAMPWIPLLLLNDSP